MTGAEWAGWGSLLTALAALIAAIGALIKTRQDKAAGVVGAEAAQRRDTIADREALIDQLQEQIATARAEMDGLRKRLDALESDLHRERQYVQRLRDWIFRGKPPPPPLRDETP